MIKALASLGKVYAGMGGVYAGMGGVKSTCAWTWIAEAVLSRRVLRCVGDQPGIPALCNLEPGVWG